VSLRTTLVAVALLLFGLAVTWPEEQGTRGPYPSDITRTPGVLNPDVTQATIHSTICVKGWTSTIRPPTSYTNELKRRQLREYGVSGPLSNFQEDHLISLSLGGHPTDPRNLWPEPNPRALEVDVIERELNEKVCAGRLTLAEAQQKESELKHTDG
jgi:hypothetical protein